eukprot:1629246-Rhodomonas_salina.2
MQARTHTHTHSEKKKAHQYPESVTSAECTWAAESLSALLPTGGPDNAFPLCTAASLPLSAIICSAPAIVPAAQSHPPDLVPRTSRGAAFIPRARSHSRQYTVVVPGVRVSVD